MQKNAPFPNRKSFHSNISHQCYNLIEIMTQKNPDDRHSSWDYLISDLDLILEGKMPAGRIKQQISISPTNVVSVPDAKITMQKQRPILGNRSINIPSALQTKQKTIELASISEMGTLIPPPTILLSFSRKNRFLKLLLKIIISVVIILLVIIFVIIMMLKH